jgi:subfamily B ATP-binding cassette protein HlyB/CyaB
MDNAPAGEPARRQGRAPNAVDSGLVSVALIARFHGRPVDFGQLRHEFVSASGRFDASAVVRSLRGLGFQTELRKLAFAELRKLSGPAILVLNDGRFAVVGRTTEREALVQFAGQERPSAVAAGELERAWSGTLVTATPSSAAPPTTRFGIAWFWEAMAKYRGLLGEIAAASFFIQLFALVTPLAFQVVIDKVLVHRGLSTLDVLVVGLIVVTLFEVVLGGLRTYVFSHTTNRVDVELGAKLFRHLLALPLSYFGARRIGDTVARLRELETVRSFMTGSALTVGIDLVFTVVFLAVMAYYSAFLTFIVIACLPLFFGVSMVLTPLLKSKLDDKFARNAENHSFLVEAVGGIETLKTMAAEPQVRRQWEERLAGYVHAAFQSGHIANLTQQGIGLIGKALTIALLWFGARLVIEGELTVGQLIAFNMLAARVNAPILRLAQLWQELHQMRVSLRRLADIMDAAAEPAFKPGRSTLPDLVGAVSFDNVTFRYSTDGPEVLKNVSFRVEPGEVLGVVGASGSGKSTLVRLLLRLYVPERGRVLVDGMDLALADPSWLRRQIGVVSQDVVLFNATVRENIALADPAMSMEEVAAAGRLAGAHEFILRLPDGYDTKLGERGGTLSGGQRQRIAIARALAGKPRMLVFDEATSALDAESERLLWDNMKAIAAGRTVFIITHRLPTLRSVDRILTLEDGRLVEEGAPRDLLARGGRYAEFHRLQLGGVNA